MRTGKAASLRRINPQSAFRNPQSLGFTLIELLVVISILVGLLAISVFAFRMTSKSFKDKAAAAQLETVLRQARNSALGSNAPAFVELEIDKEEHRPRVIPWAYRVAGQWHFEDAKGYETTGAFGINGIIRGCKPADGRVGKCLAFGYPGSRGEFNSGYVDCGESKEFDFVNGAYLEANVFGLYEFNTQRYVFKKKDCYSLRVDRGGELVGEVRGEAIRSEGFGIPPRRWTKIAFAWDARSSRLLVDDALVAVGPGFKAPPKDEPFLIGDDNASFLGLIDEVKVMAVIPGKELILPVGAKIEHNAKPWDAIFFGPDGGLDIRYHTGPLRVTIVQGRKRRAVSISMLGLTHRHKLVKIARDDDDFGGRRKKNKKEARPKPGSKELVPELPGAETKKKSKIIMDGEEVDPSSYKKRFSTKKKRTSEKEPDSKEE